MIDPIEKYILISPSGDGDSIIIEEVGRGIADSFGLPVKIKALLPDIDFAFDPERRQYHSTSILERLALKAPPEAIKIIALCDKDLFIPILTHVYGEAQLGGKACIISTFRLKQGLPPIDSQKIYLRRLIKEAVHELGHTFNLRHCPDSSCEMHYCRTINDVDHKSERFCHYCRVLLDDELKRPGKF
ncbi:MAG: archaemetzincin family Zn-dependent metalloprotease [Deltaproteobacteria bacterium]|nr:archaemetzincin family Zn-dependent metalloprotease [Deltaproteobacteria bacterium]